MKIPELLAPVGSAEHLKIAILSGASSIYLSGVEFGARKYAENFTLAEIREAVNYAHLYNVKVYVTVNTLIKENELSKVSKYLVDLYEIGVDAVLIQDIGLIKIIKENIPKLTIHASTQMNIHNIEGIKWAKSQGIKRIVLPREIEMNELKELIEYAHSQDIEIEIFAHGALCYSYSGHCLLSSLQGGRSGNRGTCAQPCREAYDLILKNESQSSREKVIDSESEGRYLLSPRDLSLYENLAEIANLNVDSIKIEGRMRSKDYVATVVSNYRQRLNELRHDNSSQILDNSIKTAEKRNKNKKIKDYDKKKQEDKELLRNIKRNQKIKDEQALEELNLVFNREFTTGHLIPKNNQNIMNNKKPGHSGLYIGNIHRYNKETQEIIIALHDNLLTIPEKGDGLLVEINPNNQVIEDKKLEREKKTKRDKQKKRNRQNNKGKGNKKEEHNENRKFQTYGFDISAKPTLKDPKDKHWRKREKDKDIKQRLLVVKKVRENKKVPITLEKGDKVYLTKRNSLNKEVKELINSKDKQSYKKSVLELYFRIDENNCPNLKGNLKLDNGKVITAKVKGEMWEEAIKKPISGDTIEKQILKIGDLPYYIKSIKIDLNSKRLFSPISKINELRRDFFNKLEEEIINSYKPNQEDLKTAKLNIKVFNDNFNNKTCKSKDKEVMKSTEEVIGEGKLAIYLNDLEVLRNLSNNNTLKDKTCIYDKVYLEIPCEKDFEEIIKENIENYNPLKSKKLNISYCVNFLKEAILISQDKNYKLIWKWPDIVHKETKESLIQILGIIKKMDLHIDVMTSLIGIDEQLKDKFNIEVYGNYPLNVFNIETIRELNNFKSLSISPELYKGNISKLLEDYNLLKEKENLPDLEFLVHGNIESMVSRKGIVSKKQLKIIENYNRKNKKDINNKENNYYLRNKKKQNYPIKTTLNEDALIILNSEELSLIEEIDYLKSNALTQFSIDSRWKPIDYIKEIGIIYKQAIKNECNTKENILLYKDIINKYSKNLTKGNFNTGLK